MKMVDQVSVSAGRVVITAHAGCMGTRPNSRESIVAAFSSEAEIVEVDIRSTKDGAVILAHDDSLSLKGGGKARLSALLHEDIRRHSAALACTPPLDLEELFSLVAELGATLRPGRPTILNLDIKDMDALPRTAALVRKHARQDSVVFSGLDRKGIEAARKELADFRYLFNADAFLPLSGAEEADMARACSLAREFGCCGINLEWTRVSGTLVRTARDWGLPVTLWTVDSREDMRTVLGFGPHSVTTNRPDLLAALISG